MAGMTATRAPTARTPAVIVISSERPDGVRGPRGLCDTMAGGRDRQGAREVAARVVVDECALDDHARQIGARAPAAGKVAAAGDSPRC
jgi:hypothetical protein